MSEAVREILHRIEQLPEDRLILEERLAELAELEWKRQAEQARQIVHQRGLDQAAIDRAIQDLRYPREGGGTHGTGDRRRWDVTAVR
jgi:hypothetical protein